MNTMRKSGAASRMIIDEFTNVERIFKMSRSFKTTVNF